jgi:hypothetical protein
LKPLTRFHLWRKLFPDVEDDYQGFSSKDVKKLESSELVNFLKGFENVEGNLERWCKVNHMNLASSA